MIEYWMTAIAFGMIFASLAMSYNLSAGSVGMLSMVHGALFGLGAYTYALLGVKIGSGASFLPLLVLAFVIAAAVGILISIVMMWLPSEFVLLVTFSIALIFTAVLYTATPLTNGAAGIPGIPIPAVFGIEIFDEASVLIMCTALALFTLVACWIIGRYPLGMAARMVRDDPMAAEGLGISYRAVSAFHFSVAGGLAAMAGAVFAGTVLYVDPHAFTIHEAILIMSMLAIGGMGNVYGAFFGGLLISLLPEFIGLLNFSSDMSAGIERLIYGVLLIAIMLVRPEGAFPERRVVIAQHHGGTK